MLWCALSVVILILPSSERYIVQLYYHRVGEPQSQDTLILKDPENPTYMWGSAVTDELSFFPPHP
jgi:hypothetical protein